MGLLQPIPQTRQNPAPPSYRAGTQCAYHSGAEGHDTNDCWTLKRAVENLIEQKRIVLKDEDVPNVTNNPLPAHNNGPIIGMICEDREFDPALKAIIAIPDVEKKPKAVVKQDKGEKRSKSIPQNTEKKVEAETGAAPSKDVVLYVPRGPKKEQMSLSPSRRFELNKRAKMYVPRGTYVVRGPITPLRLNEPVVIGRAPQRTMTNPIVVPWNYNKAVVTYKGKKISGEVKENNPAEKYLNLEEVNNATKKRFPPKKLVSAEEAEAFFQKMKMADYEVIDQLRKIVGEDGREVFAVNQISFSKNDLPPEGAAHNKALHLTVKYEGYYVKRVMLDGGSGVDICPLSTLQRMEIGTERIRPNNVCVHAFDGIKRDTIGETIGPVDFEVTFQVLDLDISYNFLLGRSLIHAAGAVPSTLHQMVKFKHEDQEIVVHEEDEQSIYRGPSVPCLEARERSEHIVYQAFEVVVADQCEEGNPCPQPFLSNASIMVAKEMIRHGYKPGKGLGKSLQEIAKPITLAASEKFFRVGFQPTSSDGKWADERKNNGWVLSQPIPHLYRTFVKPKYNEEEEDETYMVEVESIRRAKIFLKMLDKYCRYRNKCCEMHERLKANPGSRALGTESEKRDQELMQAIRSKSVLEEQLQIKNEELELGKGVAIECEHLQEKLRSMQSEMDRNLIKVEALSAE
uniref:G-patch domain-containing protein n=1 Tax=Nicotiana tabacum TaxID=4097 RepID=A0A1S3YBN4_TOBAC|nr:PREDICTED: uncharacterized protein LOC107774486 [Nicotiana tabacum]